MPGFGSLMAGRISGYPQVVLGLGGLVLTTITAARFFGWYVANSSRMQNDQGDPFALGAELWAAVRWPLLGIAVFGLGWLWAVVTSWQVLHAAKQADQAKEPPRLSQ